MVRLRRDGVVLADEVRDRLEQLDDVRPLVAVRYRGIVPEREGTRHSSGIIARIPFAGAA